MKRGLYSPACCALSLAIAAAASCGLAMVTSPKDSFAPYQVIIDRAIFGKPPPAKVAPVAAPVPDPAQKQAEALAKKITLKAVNRTPSGNTAVGLVDNDAKPPRILYLNVGDTVDGYTILAADNDAETATIEKDGVVISLQLGAGLIASGAPATTRADGRTRAIIRQGHITRRDLRTLRPDGRHPPSSRPSGMPALQREAMEQRRQEMAKIREEGGDVGSYMEKLRERQTQERAAKTAAEAAARQKIQELARQMSEEELRKQEREINLALIEGGSRPISDIELTPEEEAAILK